MQNAKHSSASVVAAMVLGALLPVLALKLPHVGGQMQMAYDDHAQMEQEILRFVPVGSSVEQAQKVMSRSGWNCRLIINSKGIRDFGAALAAKPGDSILLDCDKEISSSLTGFGTWWDARFYFEDKRISKVSVWIQPAD